MGKKLLIIPMKSQYEQHCNAAGAAELGVPVIKKLKKKYIHLVDTWINEANPIQVDYKDDTNKIIDLVLSGLPARTISRKAMNQLPENLNMPVASWV
jgi:hypothetical protein